MGTLKGTVLVQSKSILGFRGGSQKPNPMKSESRHSFYSRHSLVGVVCTLSRRYTGLITGSLCRFRVGGLGH